MKTIQFIFPLFFAILFTSCISTSFIQVYKATPSDKLINKDNHLVYEDVNCVISYDLWAKGGDMGFLIYNKTGSNLYLNLDDCFYVLNGMAYSYYQNRIFSYSKSSGAVSTLGTSASKSVTGFNFLDLLQTNRVSESTTITKGLSSGLSVSYNEDRKMCIPPGTARLVSEYSINNILIRDCDLWKYPTNKQIITKTFNKTQSPIVFTNKISYSLEGSTNPIKFDNEFYVSEITNYPETEIYKSKKEEFCGQKAGTDTKYFKNRSADKFYILYSKGMDSWKH